VADPALFGAQYNVGVAAYEAGHVSEALQAYERALAINASSMRARYNFAVTLEKAGYPRDAANEYEKIVADNPNEARVHFSLGNLYADKLRDIQRARDHYRRVLQLDSQHPQATAIRYWLEANP
jgi:tetratricopeptide (TPR) repeat protein